MMRNGWDVLVAMSGGAATVAAWEHWESGNDGVAGLCFLIAVACALMVWPHKDPEPDPDMDGDILTPEWRDAAVPRPRESPELIVKTGDASEYLVWFCGDENCRRTHVYDMGPYGKRRVCRGRRGH